MSWYGNSSFYGWLQHIYDKHEKFKSLWGSCWNNLRRRGTMCRNIYPFGIKRWKKLKEEFNFEETTFLQDWYGGTVTKPTTMADNLILNVESHRIPRCNVNEIKSLFELSKWVLLVVEVKAFQWNVRPRWGRNFWKSVRCCVQLVFSMFVFFPIDGLSWVFHGYHADDCSYSLVFWEF
jgi:hypothetical protein